MARQKFEKDDLVICTHSASPGYKTGKQYTISEDDKGNLGIKADDGFFDLVNMVVSTFRKVEETASERALRTGNWITKKKNGRKGSEPVQQPTPIQN